jgi:hypothetical protein
MIIKNTIARQDCTVSTKIETIKMLAGEVKLVRFATENEFRALLQLGVIAESQGPPPLVQRAQPVDPALQRRLTETQTQQTPPVPAPKVPEKRQCVKCMQMMIITTAGDASGRDVFFCPGCNVEESLVPKPVESQPAIEAPQSETLAPRPATAEENERGPCDKDEEEVPAGPTVADVEVLAEATANQGLSQIDTAKNALSPKISGYKKPVEKPKQNNPE